MPRRLSVSNLYSQKFKFMPFTGEWKKILGNRERKGCWMIYGNAKNGKTSFALRLANYLSSIEKVLYIAAEEGYGYSYTWAVQKPAYGKTTAHSIRWVTSLWKNSGKNWKKTGKRKNRLHRQPDRL